MSNLRPEHAGLPSDAAGTKREGEVLLVEDNPFGQAFARRVLEKAHYRVTTASKGGEAVESARKHRFDMILMDVMLPDMNGFEATRTIRANESATGLSRTPIVALSAHCSADYDEQAKALGMDDFLSKPVLPAQLLEMAAKWIPSGEAARPQALPRTWEVIRVSEDIADLVDDYLAGVHTTLQRIRELSEVNDLAPAARLAHDLKGTGAAYGFERLTQVGRQIEEALRQTDAPLAALIAAEAKEWLEGVSWTAAG